MNINDLLNPETFARKMQELQPSERPAVIHLPYEAPNVKRMDFESQADLTKFDEHRNDVR